MEAVILAGGFATRLFPLTLDKAKPLLDVGGKPAIEHILERVYPLKHRGLERILVVTSERFAADFERALSGPRPVPIEVVSNGVTDPERKLGAVGDMTIGARLVRNGPVLVLAGDNLFDYDLVDFHMAFLHGEGSPTVVVRRMPRAEDTVEYNNVRVSRSGEIVLFVEKPARPFSRRFATCQYFFPQRIGKMLKHYILDGNDPDKAGDFIRWLSRREPVRAWEAKGAWFDVGSLEVLEQAARYFSAPSVQQGGR